MVTVVGTAPQALRAAAIGSVMQAIRGDLTNLRVAVAVRAQPEPLTSELSTALGLAEIGMKRALRATDLPLAGASSMSPSRGVQVAPSAELKAAQEELAMAESY